MPINSSLWRSVRIACGAFLGLFAATPGALAQPDTSPPRIVAVSPAPGQLVTGQPLASIRVTFSEAVSPPAGGGGWDAAVSMWLNADQPFTAFTTSYDAATSTLSVLPSVASFGARLTLALDYSITDVAGNRLDGEVIDPASPLLPTGDGMPGGQTVFRFDILLADHNRDGRFNSQDFYDFLVDFFELRPAADFNQDGLIDTRDFFDFLLVLLSQPDAVLPPLDGSRPIVATIIPSVSEPISGPLNSITATFSEPVVPGRVPAESMYLVDQSGIVRAASSVTVAPDARSAVFTFIPVLPQCGTYTLNFSPIIADPSNEALLPPASPPVLSGLLPPPAPGVTPPASDIIGAPTITVSGSAPFASNVEIVGPLGALPAPVTAGAFSAVVPLRSNQINTLYVTSISPCGVRSAPSPLSVTVDAQAPELWIDLPADNEEIEAPSTDVAGRVSDLLSGYDMLAVTVNGQPAMVNPGVGTNGTFFYPALALNSSGPTVITVVATDALGNTRTRQIMVTRTAPPPDAPVMQIVSGNGQSAPIYTQVTQPIVVALSRPDDSPLVGKVVTFEVIRSDGRVTASPGPGGGAGSLFFQAITDSQGIARAYWRMGGDAGMGNNRVRVTSRDVGGTIVFCASALNGGARQINIGSGNNQRCEAGAPAPMPLEAWVSDGCNGVPNIPVTFTVAQGGGLVNSLSEITVLTSITGHADVTFTLGTGGGNNTVEATYPNMTGSPAVFNAFGVRRTAGQGTSFTGLVLDNASQPIQGATCLLTFHGINAGETTTNAQGQFSFGNIPLEGAARVTIAGQTATHVGGQPVVLGSYPNLGYDAIVVRDAANSLATPVLLPPLNLANRRLYSTTAETELTVEGIEGLRMIVAPGSMRLPNGQLAPNGTPISLNTVHHDDVPMPMPDGAAPLFAWTLQPAGATFNPPIRIEYPNMSALPAGSIAYFLTFNHATSAFEIVSSGHVTNDGSTIVTDEGSGLTLAGWGCNCPPYSVTGECRFCPAEGDCTINGQTMQCDPCLCVVDALRRDYEMSRGTPSAALKHQLYCIADRSCGPNAQPCAGHPGWADGFVRRTLGDIANNIGSNVFNDIYDNMPAWLITALDAVPGLNAADFAALDAGVLYHFPLELVPAFYRHCELLDDESHNCFFNAAVIPCFQEVDELSPAARAIAQRLVPALATALREGVQIDCAVLNLLGLRGDDQYPVLSPPPPESALFSPEFASVGTLDVSTLGTILLRPGQSVQLQVLRINPDGTQTDVAPAAAGTLYHQLIRDSIVTISPNGLVTALRTPTPLRSIPGLIQIFAVNGGEVGIGQIAVVDEDSDGDLLVDSYEVARGLDPHRRNVRTSDLDNDGLTDLHEALLGTDIRDSDTDDDGISDGIEIRIGSDPRDENSNRGNSAVIVSVTVSGQTTATADAGDFRLSNIAAPDRFGTGGPGSNPDFQSDDFLRVTGTSVRAGQSVYAFSDPFQITSGQRYIIGDMTITTSPPPLPVALSLNVCTGCPSVLEPDQTVQLVTIGTLGNGTHADLTLRSAWTTYRTSNPAVATVGPNGLVTAVARGTAFITAHNDGVTTTKRLDVVTDAATTTIVGLVELPDGSPAAGAMVTLLTIGGEVMTGADGRFTLPATVPANASLTVVAQLSINGTPHAATASGLMPVGGAGGLTDAGVLALRPLCDPRWASGLFPLPGTDGPVRALTVFDDGTGPALYAGGGFTTAGGAAANYVAKWNGSAWSPLGSGVSSEVLVLTVFDDGTGPALYAGGLFFTAGGAAANYVAKWNGSAWRPLGSGMNNWVSALTVFDDGTGPALFAGGLFTAAGGVAANRIAKWNGSAWSPLGSGTTSSVDALTVFDDGTGPALYVGGNFTTVGGVAANRIAKWDGAAWSPLGSGMNNDVRDLTIFDDGTGPALYAGGSFTTAGGAAANRIAKWSGTAWSPLGSGTSSSVDALTVFDDGTGPALYAGGNFTIAGGGASAYMAKWYRPTDCNGILPPGFTVPPTPSGPPVPTGLTPPSEVGPLDRRRLASTPVLPHGDAHPAPPRTSNIRGERLSSMRVPHTSGESAHAAVVMPDGTVIDLGSLAGDGGRGGFSRAVAMNERGDVIGWSSPPSRSHSGAAASSPSSSPATREALSAHTPAVPGDIEPGSFAPFFWSRDTGMVELHTLIEPGDPSGLVPLTPASSSTAGGEARVHQLLSLSDDRVVSGVAMWNGEPEGEVERHAPFAAQLSDRLIAKASRSTRCPADVNRDGLLDSRDVFAYLDAFFEGNARADFDADGITTPGDYAKFLAAYLSGCP